jgi:hypothetical protein
MEMMIKSVLIVLGMCVVSCHAAVESISNGVVSVAVDLDVGCAITSFVDESNGINMINTADLGR